MWDGFAPASTKRDLDKSVFQWTNAPGRPLYWCRVPRDAKVVDLTRAPGVEELKAAAEAASQGFCPAYFAVDYRRLKAVKGACRYPGTVILIYVKNGRERRELYGVPLRDGTARVDTVSDHEQLWKSLPADDIAAWEAWANGRQPLFIEFSDGKHRVICSLDEEGKLLKERHESRRPAGLNLWHLPLRLQNVKALAPVAGPWGAREGLESYRFGGYERWYFNPGRSYICEFHETGWDPSRKGDRITVVDPERRFFKRQAISEYARTASGRWYPKRIEEDYLRHRTRRRGTGAGADRIVEDREHIESTYVSVIHIDERREIPDELLDPDRIVSAEDLGKKW